MRSEVPPAQQFRMICWMLLATRERKRLHTLMAAPSRHKLNAVNYSITVQVVGLFLAHPMGMTLLGAPSAD